MTLVNEMYKENILELYRNPLNFGIISKPTFSHKEFNSLCGDNINITLKVENNIIKNAKFNGNGCAISIASASLITDKIKNMKLNDVMKLNSKDVIKMLGIKIKSSRLKCALLPLDAVKKSLSK